MPIAQLKPRSAPNRLRRARKAPAFVPTPANERPRWLPRRRGALQERLEAGTGAGLMPAPDARTLGRAEQRSADPVGIDRACGARSLMAIDP